jgi:tRNA (adenine-N(1)-)-methyltransferase non-catalytic subunit
LCNYWFEKNPAKTLFMRNDTLSQMLTMINVKSGSRILCVDDTGGLLILGLQLLTLRLLERINGKGEIFTVHDRTSQNMDIAISSNINKSHLKCVKPIPWTNLDGKIFENFRGTDEASLQRAKIKQGLLTELYDNFKTGQFEGLLVASKYDPKEIISKLKHLLAPSSPIVVYSPYKEMLLPCYNEIRYSTEYVFSTLVESFMREYKAPVGLSGTHPTMTTSGCGGFYFWCFKVDGNITILEKENTKRIKNNVGEEVE